MMTERHRSSSKGDDRSTVFPGGQVYDRMHAYLAYGFHDQLRAKIRRLVDELGCS